MGQTDLTTTCDQQAAWKRPSGAFFCPTLYSQTKRWWPHPNACQCPLPGRPNILPAGTGRWQAAAEKRRQAAGRKRKCRQADVGENLLPQRTPGELCCWPEGRQTGYYGCQWWSPNSDSEAVNNHPPTSNASPPHACGQVITGNWHLQEVGLNLLRAGHCLCSKLPQTRKEGVAFLPLWAWLAWEGQGILFTCLISLPCLPKETAGVELLPPSLLTGEHAAGRRATHFGPDGGLLCASPVDGGSPASCLSL